ncbi:MAG: hypothetical protein KGH84_04525 [Paracoccaceae bacterium]|nr:hypothetical protein [Paracoccaceae bacterium]
MTRPLTPEERDSLIALYRDGGPAPLRLALTRHADCDLAGLPFRLLDALLAEGEISDPDALASLADLLPAGQPRLFGAICAGLARNDTTALQDIAAATSSHRISRWEATGWAVFLRHRAPLPSAPGAQIPHLVQFWDQPDLPHDLAGARAAWVSHSPKSTLFDAAHAARFITRDYGPQAAAAFTALWHPAAQSDLFRLYYLLARGGLYVDADSLPGPAVAPFMAHGGGAVWASAMTRVPKCVTINGFLAAPKGAPLIAAYLDHVLRNLHDSPEGPIYWLCGPGALTRFLASSDHTIRLLPHATLQSRLFRQIDAAYKYTDRNWRVHESRRGLNDATTLAAMFP